MPATLSLMAVMRTVPLATAVTRPSAETVATPEPRGAIDGAGGRRGQVGLAAAGEESEGGELRGRSAGPESGVVGGDGERQRTRAGAQGHGREAGDPIGDRGGQRRFRQDHPIGEVADEADPEFAQRGRNVVQRKTASPLHLGHPVERRGRALLSQSELHVGIERTAAVRRLEAVGNAVAVGVPIVRIGPHHEFLQVGQAVAVGVLRRIRGTGRIEAPRQLVAVLHAVVVVVDGKDVEEDRRRDGAVAHHDPRGIRRGGRPERRLGDRDEPVGADLERGLGGRVQGPLGAAGDVHARAVRPGPQDVELHGLAGVSRRGSRRNLDAGEGLRLRAQGWQKGSEESSDQGRTESVAFFHRRSRLIASGRRSSAPGRGRRRCSSIRWLGRCARRRPRHGC